MVRMDFVLYFANKNGNISPVAVTRGNLINLAAVEKRRVGKTKKKKKEKKKLWPYFKYLKF